MVRPTFIFLGGGKTAAAEFVALINTKHEGVRDCRLIVFCGIPSKNYPDALSLVEVEARKVVDEAQPATWEWEHSKPNCIIFKRKQERELQANSL